MIQNVSNRIATKFGIDIQKLDDFPEDILLASEKALDRAGNVNNAATYFLGICKNRLAKSLAPVVQKKGNVTGSFKKTSNGGRVASPIYKVYQSPFDYESHAKSWEMTAEEAKAKYEQGMGNAPLLAGHLKNMFISNCKII